MNPTALYRSGLTFLTILGLALAQRDDKARASQVEYPGRQLAENRTTSNSEPIDGLTRLVEQALQRSERNQTAIEGIWRGLQVTARTRDNLSGLPSHERLVILDNAGRIAAAADVTEALSIDEGELGKRLLAAGPDIVLIHNHLMGRGLSRNDLAQLTNPRVKAVIAVGHDGSLYAASLGEAFVSLRREEPPMAPAGIVSPTTTSIMDLVASAMAQVGQLRKTVAVHADVYSSHFDHLASLALGKARAIDYRFVLAEARQRSFSRFELEFKTISDDVASRVTAQMTHRTAARSR